MAPVCFAIDFDYSIAHFKNGYDGLFDIFVRRNIPREKVESVYEHVKHNGGFTIGGLVNAFGPLAGFRFGRNAADAIRKEFDEWLSDSLVPYPESIAALAHLQKIAPVVIVTFGNEEFQRQKVARLSIPHHELLITEDRNGKPALIEYCVEKYGSPVVFVDDKASELDRISDAFPKAQVLTVHLLRKDSPYRKNLPRYSHHAAPDLNGLDLLFA